MVTTARPTSPWMLLTALLLAADVSLAVAAPPGMVPDAARGLMVWQSMQRGSAFNVLREPNSRDLSHDGDSFMTWWTPGQYAVPASFTVLHLNLGYAILATVILGTLGGLAGGYALFMSLGFAPEITAASVSIIAAWRYLTLAFRNYTGGEILLFGIAPWAILVALKCRRLGARDIIALIVVTLAGIFLKSAFVICALAMLVSLGVIRVLERRATPVYAAKLAACFMLPCAIYYIVFGRFGSTPAGLFAESLKGVFGLLFAVSTPLFAATSLSDVLNRIFLYPAAPRLGAPDQLWPLFLVGAAVALICYLQMVRRAPSTLYRGLLGGFLVTYIAAFGVLYLFGAAVNTDDRYFRPPAFLVVPGLLQAILALRSKTVRAAAFCTVGGLALYGPLAYVTHWPTHHREPVGRLGFTHEEISAEALSHLKALDQDAPPGSVFYVPTPALALELQRARAITANAIFEDAATLSARAYRGHVETLIVAVPASLGPDRTHAILTSFVDIPGDRWTRESAGDYLFYSQTAP